MAFLKVFSQGEERTVFLGDTPVVIGRGEDCDVFLPDVKVSRHHCRIERSGPDSWRVRDLGSGNGTKVNGKAYRQRVLEPDDVITVGDARIVFAGEAVAVIAEEPPAGRPEGARRAPKRGSHARAWVFVAVLAFVAGAVGVSVWQQGGRTRATSQGEQEAFQAVRAARGDRELIELAETFRTTYPASRFLPELDVEVAAARRRLQEGTSGVARGYDPRPEIEGLAPHAAVTRLEDLLAEASPEQRPAVRALLAECRARLDSEREAFFGRLETTFRALVEGGEYARAREMWFFLAEEPAWVPIPDEYVSRVVDANRDLENSATASRGALFEEVAGREAAGEFAAAEELLVRALPRFQGTSVARSLDERLEFIRRAAEEAAHRPPTFREPPVVTVDVARRMQDALAVLGTRDFRGAATALRALAAEVAGQPAFEEVDARARECEAAAALHDTTVAALSEGFLPKAPVARRWRVTGADASGVRARVGGEENGWTWASVPSELYLGLLAMEARRGPETDLGLAVAAHAVGGEPALIPVLAALLGGEGEHAALDAFVAARVRNEPRPEGGYAVDGGEILTRREYVKRREQELVAQLKEQFEKAYETVRSDKAFARLERLRRKKDDLDKARAHALELIYDEKAYFYPYRGTGREGEYNKVQQEVDRRVAAVRELWDERLTVKVGMSSDLRKALERFDAAAQELAKRFVDVEEKVQEIAFLRAYVGHKFDIRSLFRTPEELDLLAYSDEVMAFNVGVKGDITPVERRQVEVTNEYRMMFGRWPVRLIEALVLSSRGHCEEMSRIGYFGHFSPTEGRRTPYERMMLQGYEDGASENCIMGQTEPVAAHKGWCHSSGHHRNLLMAEWTEMGTGHYGYYMTQNFGRAAKWSTRDPKPEASTPWEWPEEPEAGDDGFDYEGDGEE